MFFLQSRSHKLSILILNYLDIPLGVKAIQLVEELQHGPLDFPFTTGVTFVPLRSYGIDLINEDNRRSMLFCYSEQLPDQLWSVTKILLNQLWANNSQKCCRCLIGHGLSQQSLSSAGRTVEDDTFRWFDSHLLVIFRMSQWQLHRFLRNMTN